MLNIIYIIIGAVAGFTAAWFIRKFQFESIKGLSKEESDRLKSDLNNLSNDKLIISEKYKIVNDNLQSVKNELEEKTNKILDLSKELSSTNTSNRNLQEKLSEHKKEIDEINKKFSLEFKNLANEIFEEKTGKFTEQNKINLDTLLNPLHDRIKDFEKKVNETYDKEAQQRFSLKEEVKKLADLNHKISDDAKNLTKALKGEAKTQGNWGELILENILERSGLAKNREYFVQESYQSDDGKRYQPDVVIEYPGKRNVIIDSKVSLTAYERYTSATEKEEQEKALDEHLLSVKNHIKELSNKNYQDLYGINSLDFVMLFMPIEPAYLAAIQKDTELWNFAFDKRILLIGPTNLIAALKMIASMWLQEYQSQNVLDIAKKSGDLYDKFVGFITDLEDVGNKLNATQKAYDNSMNKLSTGKGNLISRVENIKKLGAKTKKEIPNKLIDKAIE
ncbi:MAG: DNA recombination protein RmuC [Bacteroidales bacterium]|jgi:DNA recombination protein RmuC|nr:DNA recombination protein RmuC [Bacteroidales bacterium]